MKHLLNLYQIVNIVIMIFLECNSRLRSLHLYFQIGLLFGKNCFEDVIIRALVGNRSVCGGGGGADETYCTTSTLSAPVGFP